MKEDVLAKGATISFSGLIVCYGVVYFG